MHFAGVSDRRDRHGSRPPPLEAQGFSGEECLAGPRWRLRAVTANGVGGGARCAAPPTNDENPTMAAGSDRRRQSRWLAATTDRVVTTQILIAKQGSSSVRNGSKADSGRQLNERRLRTEERHPPAAEKGVSERKGLAVRGGSTCGRYRPIPALGLIDGRHSPFARAPRTRLQD